MKKLIALLLTAALLLSVTGCLGFRPEKKETTEPPVEETQPVVDYAALEQILEDYAYGWVGGGMLFSRCGTRLYFPDREYNTAGVLYYDFADGSLGKLAADRDNPLSGPPACAPESILVSSFPPGSDPLEELDYAGRSLHIYDLKTGELTVVQTYPDFFPLAFSGGVLYGVEEPYEAGSIILADQNGSRSGSIPLPEGMQVLQLLPCRRGIYALVGEGDGEDCALMGVGQGQPVTLQRVSSRGWFDGSAYWYALGTQEGAQLRKFDLETGQDLLLGVVSSVSHIYFAAGERLYYSRRLSEAGDIAVLYYDIAAGEETELSHDFPALGGW